MCLNEHNQVCAADITYLPMKKGDIFLGYNRPVLPIRGKLVGLQQHGFRMVPTNP
jgi:hypothetical protein